MGLGKITRGLGKVGLALEALGYVVTAAKALGRAFKRAPGARRDDDKVRQEPRLDSARGMKSQGTAAPSPSVLIAQVAERHADDDDRH